MATSSRDAVSTRWLVDEVRPAKVYGNAAALDAALPNAEDDNEGHFIVPGFLLSAHKAD